ncbi:MAG: DNA adenine methylase [Chloroflexi bacterium]|nr:DNA adenine methylase [Chloroflexota bacterium]
MAETAPARPFLKWAGGKSRLLSQLEPLFPKTFTGYHEPFVGSGAVYFRLRALRPGLRRVRLTDSNEELINCYSTLRDSAEAVIRLLARHKQQHSRDHYYAVRAQPPDGLDSAARAARFIYLNKTCYNGLYRVNQSGQFNVPMGRYVNPTIFDAGELRQASAALQNVALNVADFWGVTRLARRSDFVYFDPPYHPLSPTANFTSYTAAAFGEPHQRQLADVYRALDRKGCRVMLSNSWTPFVLQLYKGYERIEVKAARAINSKAAGRGKVSEVVVLNYKP